MNNSSVHEVASLPRDFFLSKLVENFVMLVNQRKNIWTKLIRREQSLQQLNLIKIHHLIQRITLLFLTFLIHN